MHRPDQRKWRGLQPFALYSATGRDIFRAPDSQPVGGMEFREPEEDKSLEPSMHCRESVLSIPPSRIQTVAILGLGLLGASLAAALRRRRPDLRVLGYARRSETIEKALQRDMIHDGSTDPAPVLKTADLSVLCIPIRATIDFVREHTALWRTGSVVTDVGSVKAPIVNAVRPLLHSRGVHYVGSHPMAGSDRSGLEYASSDLYQGAIVFMTVVDGDAPAAVGLVADFWRRLGTELHELPPEHHDALVARTSHALHLVASASVQAYLTEAKAQLATGGAFRDFTRIAASSPAMWREIVEFNRTNLLAAFEELDAQLAELRRLMTAGAWDALTDYLAAARESREAWGAQWHQRKQSAV